MTPGADDELIGLRDLHVWLGLKSSDDQGTQFDVRAEVYGNGSLVASGLARCVTGIARSESQAKEVAVSFAALTPVTLGAPDTLTLKLSTRIGTNADDTKCAGHNNAVGLRAYFDSVGRPARFDAVLAGEP